MDALLNLQHEVESCAALAFAVSAMLYEVIDSGCDCAKTGEIEHAGMVIGMLQDRLEQARALATGAAQYGMQG